MAEGDNDFREVAHCGGKIKFHIRTDESGPRGYSVECSHASPTPAAWFAVYALPQGERLATFGRAAAAAFGGRPRPRESEGAPHPREIDAICVAIAIT
jgi:hypothetical protein